MPTRKIILLVVALLIAITTVMMARSILSSGKGAKSGPSAEVAKEILVAARDLPSGTLLKDSDLKWMPWPSDEGTGKYVLKGKGSLSEYAGTVVRYGLREGEPIVTGRIVKPGQSGFMAAALAPGMRAVSISITPVAGVAGFVFPGDKVDVIVTHQIGGKNHNGVEGSTTGRKVSETVLQDVRVLALDQKMNDQVSEPKIAQIATLEVTPKQAETVTLSHEIGTLSLALRSIANDPEPVAETAQPATEGDSTGIAVDAAALALPDAGQVPGLTWDSDVSRVLPRPANRIGAVQKITIIRGKEATEAVYDLTNP